MPPARRSPAPAPVAAPARWRWIPAAFTATTPATPSSTAPRGEISRLREERDCLRHFRRRVGEAGLLDAALLDEVDTEVAALVERSVAEAHAAPAPDAAALLRDVYVSY